MLFCMVVKAAAAHTYFTNIYCYFRLLPRHMIVACLVIILYLPSPTPAETIHLHEIRTVSSFPLHGASDNNSFHGETEKEQAINVFSSGRKGSSEPNILKVYAKLFKQTWEHSPEIQVARRLQDQKFSEKYTAWARRISPQVDLEISQKQFFNKEISANDPMQDGQQQLAEELLEEYYKDGEELTHWEFDLDLPIYKRALSLAIDISDLEYELAANNLEIKNRELDSRLHALLGNYMVACYKLHNLENSIVLSREHVKKIRRGYDLRDQTKLALLRAQANLKELEARKDLNEQRRDSTFRELLDYTAIPEYSPSWFRLNELLDTEERTAGCINSFAALDTGVAAIQDFLAKSTTDETLRNFFVENSFLYKKIILERDLGRTRAKKYTQQEWPALFVRGELDRKDDTRFENYSGEGSIGLVLSVPLFSGGTIFSTSKTKDMAARITSIQEQSNMLRTFNSIANKKKSISSLQAVFQKQQIHLQQQQEIVRLSLKSYQIKQTSMQELLTSKNQLIDAKNLLMRTTADLGILLRQFAWELGAPFPAPSPPALEM